MNTSLALLAALTLGANGEVSTIEISSQAYTTRQAQEDYSENSPRSELSVVQLVSEHATSGSASVPLVSNIENGGPEQNATLKLEDEEAYGFEDCSCCVDSNPYGHFGFHHRFYPSPCYSPGNMTQHFPYVAEPKNYYYFRPYNWFHILDQQKEVVLYGGDPRHPYANDLFQEVYQEIEAASDSSQSGN